MASNYVQKVWVDRDSQYPDRRVLIDIDTNVAKTYDIQRAEGVIREEGTQLTAENFNNLENRIASQFDTVGGDISSLQGEVSSTSGRVDDIEDSVSDLSDSVDNLSSTVTNISDSVDNLSDTVATKQDTLTAGTGISIVNNVISISLIDADAQEY